MPIASCRYWAPPPPPWPLYVHRGTCGVCACAGVCVLVAAASTSTSTSTKGFHSAAQRPAALAQVALAALPKQKRRGGHYCCAVRGPMLPNREIGSCLQALITKRTGWHPHALAHAHARAHAASGSRLAGCGLRSLCRRRAFLACVLHRRSCSSLPANPLALDPERPAPHTGLAPSAQPASAHGGPGPAAGRCDTAVGGGGNTMNDQTPQTGPTDIGRRRPCSRGGPMVVVSGSCISGASCGCFLPAPLRNLGLPRQDRLRRPWRGDCT